MAENNVQTEPKYPEGGIVVDNTQKDGSVVKRIFYPKQKKIIELVQDTTKGVTPNGLWTVTEYWPDLKKAKQHMEWMSADGEWAKQSFPEYGNHPSSEVKDSQGNVSQTVWLTDKEINRLKKDMDRVQENNAKKPEPEKKVVKNVVKMPDLSNLRYVYQKGSSEKYDATNDLQLIATLKEGLSEEELKNPIVKAVLEAYAKKDAAKRKEALSQLNDMVKTEADLAIAQKIANEAQYDKPFDVPEIEHELSSSEPKVLAEKLPNGSIRTITEKDGFKLIETKRPDGSLDTKETIAPDGTKSTEYYEGGFLQGKLTETPDGTETSEWYNKDGSLSSKETETPDGTKTYESYRKDGSPYSKAIKTPDGTLTYDYYREDGSLRSKETKTPDGTWTFEDYREDGSLRRKLTETRDGTETSENYNEKGVKTSESITDKEGNITSKGYDDDGNLSFTMVHNKEKGTYVQYDENGKLKKLVIKEPNGTTKVRTGLRAKLSALATGTSRRLPTKDRSDR